MLIGHRGNIACSLQAIETMLKICMTHMPTDFLDLQGNLCQTLDLHKCITLNL
jgi:hypothetical protein